MYLTLHGLRVDAGSGPGSRGGHVIGKTSTGKPIYANHGHVGHRDFTREEHAEALAVHKGRDVWKELHGDLPVEKATPEQIKTNIKAGNQRYKAIEFHQFQSQSAPPLSAANTSRFYKSVSAAHAGKR